MNVWTAWYILDRHFIRFPMHGSKTYWSSSLRTHIYSLNSAYFCVSSFLDIKHFDPAHITSALHGIQSSFSSQSEAEQRLEENCRRAGLRFHGHIPADGNCFFHAVSDQLSLLGLSHQSAAQLRSNVVLYLLNHPQIQVYMSFNLFKFGQNPQFSVCIVIVVLSIWPLITNQLFILGSKMCSEVIKKLHLTLRYQEAQLC